MTSKAKIYGLFLPCYSAQKDELLKKLQVSLPDVEFVGLDKLSGINDTDDREDAYRNIAAIRDELAGIVVFGGYLDRGLTSLGLPVIMVRSLFGTGDWDKGILSFYAGEKLLAASLSNFDISSKTSSQRFADLIDKISLLAAIAKVKSSKLLIVQEPKILGSYDIEGMDFHVPLPGDYNEVYPQRLKEMGPNVEHVSLEELNKEMDKTPSEEAIRLANTWIEGAEQVVDTNREEILKATSMYIAIERLLKKYRADGITIRSLVPWVKEMTATTPCLANTELNKQLKTGVCEGLVNSAVTEMFGIHAIGRPSFIGDVVGVDRENDTVTFAHCQCPINPHGDDRLPYIIRSHALQKGNPMLPSDYPEAGSTPGVAVQVKLPLNEPVTAVKFSLYDEKIAVSTGISVSGEALYRDFEDILCRTKLVMRTNTRSFEKYYDTATFGVHRNIIFGDHRQRIDDLATLIGFTVVEEGGQPV